MFRDLFNGFLKDKYSSVALMEEQTNLLTPVTLFGLVQSSTLSMTTSKELLQVRDIFFIQKRIYRNILYSTVKIRREDFGTSLEREEIFTIPHMLCRDFL